jgi:hypothetical protein
MDRDNEVRPWMPGNPIPARPPVYRGLYLQRLRETYNGAALDHLPTPRRQRRVIAYALTEPGGTADRGLAVARALIESQEHAIAYELTDSLTPYASPHQRPGWIEARRLVYCGFADGIAVVNRLAVSRRDDEYEDEIRWIGQRPGLLLVAEPEAAT